MPLKRGKRIRRDSLVFFFLLLKIEKLRKKKDAGDLPWSKANAT